MSPRATVRRERSSAPAMNASRKRWFRLRRRAASLFASTCESAIERTFELCHSLILPVTAQRAEPDSDLPAVDGDNRPGRSLLDLAAQIGKVVAQDVQVLGPVRSDVGRVELPGHDRREGADVPQRGTDHLVTGIGRRLVLYRTDVLIRRNPARAPPSYDHTETPPPVSKEDQHERDLFYA